MLKEQGKLEEGRKTVLPKLKAKEQMEHKQDKRAQRKNRNRIYYTWYAALKGKDKHYFNIFIYMCDHLICKENQEIIDQKKRHRKDVHRWISDFLSKMEFKKNKGEPYNDNDIKKMIKCQFEDSFKETKFSLELFCSFVDDEFKSFCNPTHKPTAPDSFSVKPKIWES